VNVGAADLRGYTVRFGFKGMADLSGIVQGGRRLEIECKTKTGRLSKEQERFGAMIERFGGIYIVARSADDAVRQLEARL